MNSTDVWMQLNAVPGRYIKRDLGSPLTLGEADGSELLVVPNAIFDAIKAKLVLSGGKYIPAPAP
jgi:hypothetical protein